MAIKVAIASGNFNTAGTWYTGTETNTGGASTFATFSPATRYSAVFTAPNTTNACVGSYVHINTLSTTLGATITATLQEYNGSTWNDCAGASAVLTESDLDGYRVFAGTTSISAGFLFKFTTPYVYTTTTAGYYRFKYVRSSVSSASGFYASTVASEVWSIVVDDRTGAVGSTDVCYIAGVTGAKTTVTLDGACACGQTVATDGSDYSLLRPEYSANWAMVIGYMGQVIPDTTQNTTLTINGSSPIVVIGGQLNFGTTAAPHTASYTAKIVFNPKTTYACGFRVYGHNKSLEHFSFVGQTKTYQTNYVSGTGITGSELVVANATGWVVGDLIAFSGSTYNTHEHRYIKTISGTTITLSNSVGGAESALTNTHYAADWVLNLSRNVGITSSGAGKAWFAYMQCTSTANGVAKYAEFSNIAGNASSRYAFFITQSARYAINYDGCSWYDIVNSFTSVGHQWAYGYGSQILDNTYKNCVHYAPVTPLTYAYSLVRLGILACSSTNVTNNYFVGGRYSGAELAGYGSEYDGFHVRNASASYSSSATYTGIQMNSGADVTLTNSTVNACRSNAMSFASGTTNYKIKNCSFGTVYANSSRGDIGTSAYGSFHTVVFDSCDLTSTEGWVLYTLDTNSYIYDAIGSQFAFQNYDNEAGNHVIYKPDGIIQRTAAGLTDTTVRTTGGSCLRFESNNTITRLEWMQHVPTGDIQNKSMTVGVWCKINHANYYAGTKEMPRLTLVYDNGTKTYVEATATTDWQFLSMSFTPTTTYPDIILTLSAMTDATSTDAYVYFTDFAVLYPAGHQLKLGEMAYFADGEPLKPTIATNLSPADVWAVNTSGLTGDGTIGKFVTKLLTVAKFLGLK